jgi:hypothetical protein
MKFSLSINTDTDAFKDNPKREIARILRDLAELVANRHSHPLASFSGTSLRDFNGETVGRVHVGIPAEDLTIAYIAMGATRAIDEVGCLPDDVCDQLQRPVGLHRFGHLLRAHPR